MLLEEDKGCPATMAHVDLRPHPDYIDISQLINTFNAGVFIEEKLFIVRLFPLVLIKMIEIEIKPLLGQLTLSIWIIKYVSCSCDVATDPIRCEMALISGQNLTRYQVTTFSSSLPHPHVRHCHTPSAK